MARIRSIKPEFWRSPSTAKASPRARLLYIAMWNWADDYGVAEWTPRELLGFAFPNDEEIRNAEFQSLCTEVATCFGTQFYTINGRRFYCIPAWDDHQKNERRAQGKYPRPDTPDACIDGEIHGNTETHGSSVRKVGSTGTGTGEQGNRGTGNREQGKSHEATETLFDDAYSHWPKKTKREEALDRFKKAVRPHGGDPVALAADIIRFGDAYAATTEKKFTPALGVWLNQKRWTDELPSSDTSRPTRTQQNLSVVAQYAALENQQKGINQ